MLWFTIALKTHPVPFGKKKIFVERKKKIFLKPKLNADLLFFSQKHSTSASKTEA